MRRRTKARECALKMLYAIDITKNSADECIDIFWKNHETVNDEIKNFADYLTKGVYKNAKFIDKIIAKYKPKAFIDPGIPHTTATYQRMITAIDKYNIKKVLHLSELGY